VSLIADSLKKAIKEKSAPKWEASRETNPVGGNREPEKRPRLPTVFRIILLVILPAAVLAYLISIDAFSLKKTSVTQKPDLPAAVPVEEARVAPPSKPAPVAPPEKPVAVSSKKPTKKTSVEKETAALKTPDKPPAGKKEKTGVKRIVPSSVPEKKSSQPKKAIIAVPAAPDEKAVALSSPESKPPSPVIPKIPPSATEKKTSAVISKEKPALNQPEVEIPDHEIAMPPAPPVKSSVEPALEKAEVSAEQKTAPAVAEKKTSAVVSEETHALNQPEAEIPDHEIAMPPAPPVQSSVEPALEKAEVSPEQETAPAFAEKKTDAVVSKKTPALNQSEVEIPDHEIATRQEPPAKSPVEPDFKKGPSSPAVQENPEVASLPAPSLKPEISRIDPKDQENVFNSSDYYFNRGIFFQQAGDWEKALVNYSKSEELEPNNPDTYNNKGVVLKEMGEYDKALDEFLRAVFLDAGYAKAYNNIGVVYYMQKNYPEAIKHYLKAIDINPTNLEAFNNLAIIYKKQKESDKARGILNRALSLDPDHPGTNYNLAVLYEENREIKPALHFYRRFIDLGARNYPSLVLQVKEHLEGMKPQ